MPPWYVVMIASALVLLFWFWWVSPSHPRSNKPAGSGQDVIDEAVTAFDDLARQVVNSGAKSWKPEHDHPVAARPIADGKGKASQMHEASPKDGPSRTD